MFEKTPEEIKPLLTPSLTLRCSLHDSAPPTGSDSLVGRRDVTHTDDNIRDLVSVVVTRNGGQHVASVTQFSPPRGLLDAGNLNVTGDINTGHEERGYLELVWTDPDASQSGTYSCEVNAMTPQGHNVVFSQTAEVEVTTPTLDDLVQHVHDQGVNILLMKQEMAKADTARLELSKELVATKEELKTTRLDLDHLQLQLDAAKHIENGTLKCGHSRDWKGDYSTGYKVYQSTSVSGSFVKAYQTSPIVHIGVVESKVELHETYNGWYEVSLVKVDKAGFVIKCYQNGYPWSNMFGALSVNWISFSN